MATVTFGLLNYTSINTCESTTGFTKFDTLDPDFALEGSNAMTGTFRTDTTEGYYDNGSAPVTAVGKHVRFWLNTTNLAYMDTEANGGYELLMYDGTTSEYKTMFGSDTYKGGNFNMVFDCDSFTTLTLSAVQRWGIRIQHTASAKNIDNVWIDYIRYLDGYYITGGTSGDEVDLTLIAARDIDDGAGTLRGYGIITETEGVYFCTGKLTIGNSTTTTYFDMNGEVLIFPDYPVATSFYEISADGTVAVITIADSTIKSAGTTDATRYVFDFSNTSVTFTMTGTVLQRSAAITFASGQTVTGNTFNNCDQITHGGADMDNSVVKNYEGTANTSALIYNVAVDPDGEMDGMTFEKGTAATHAIEFGTTSPLTMTLRDVTCTGYNASDTQNDSTFHFKRTSGTVTLNLIGFTGNYSYRSDGATINIVVSPVTHTVNVKNNAGDNLQNVRVIVETAATIASGEIFEAAVTSLTQSAGTATCTTTAVHGLTTNDYVVIRGAQPDEYNKVAQVTVSSTTVFTYTVPSGITTPATGTPIVSFVGVYGLTDVNGDVSNTRSWGADQTMKGWARNTATGSPYYKQGTLAFDIDSTNGKTTNIILQPDE